MEINQALPQGKKHSVMDTCLGNNTIALSIGHRSPTPETMTPNLLLLLNRPLQLVGDRVAELLNRPLQLVGDRVAELLEGLAVLENSPRLWPRLRGCKRVGGKLRPVICRKLAR